MKVYVVADGDYSDYRVEGIYSTKEKAELAQKLYAAYDGIQEWELDEMPDHPKGMLRYSIRINRDGDINCIELTNADDVEKKISWQPWGDDKNIRIDMWARDEKHAVKIANEQRTGLILRNEWTTDWDAWVQKEDKK